MLQFEELKLQLSEYLQQLEELKEALNLNKVRDEAAQLEKLTTADGFWNDLDNSQRTLKKLSNLKETIKKYSNLKQQYDDVLALIEMADEEEDLSLLDEVTDLTAKFIKDFEEMLLVTLLSDEYDKNNAILTFHAGAGGTEAQDWVEMLVRMYTKWSDSQGFKTKILDYLDGEEAGLKSAVVLFEGTNAYGYLKSENGVHRLVRVSPFDSSGRRHTSFASIEVMPEINDDINIEISADQLKVDTYRASGAGGQHVNKTESAVRITHIPSGIVVACQNERSQHQNRDMAMRMLKSKLIEIKEREHLDKVDDIKGVQKEIGWGSQIRSYVFMPYTLVKDHRTSFENGNINAVMNGDLDGFINAYLKDKSKKNI